MSTTSINKQLNNEISQRLHGPYYGTTKTDTVSKYRQSSWRGDMRSDVPPPQQAPVQDRAETQWKVESGISQPMLSTMPHRPAHDTTSPVPFFHLIERLKTTKRTGWTDAGIEDGESISDHMYRMAILAMVAPSSIASRINMSRCVCMALIHDMGEALVGDITQIEGVSKAEKSRRESAAMDYISERLLGSVHLGLSGQSIRALWQEYEDDETLDAHFVHDLDKFEHVLQMVEYERRYEGRKDLSEFTWICSRIRLPEVREWCDAVLEERKQLWDSVGKETECTEETECAEETKCTQQV